MSSERFWILVLAVTSFLAGLAAGVLFSLDRIGPDAGGPFGSYRERLVVEYGLSDYEAGRLQQILAAYDEEIERLKARQLQAFDADLIRAGRECSERIATYIIPEDRKDEFRLACGIVEPEPFSPNPQVH